jgi:hypothetical protein
VTPKTEEKPRSHAYSDSELFPGGRGIHLIRIVVGRCHTLELHLHSYLNVHTELPAQVFYTMVITNMSTVSGGMFALGVFLHTIYIDPLLVKGRQIKDTVNP